METTQRGGLKQAALSVGTEKQKGITQGNQMMG